MENPEDEANSLDNEEGYSAENNEQVNWISRLFKKYIKEAKEATKWVSAFQQVRADESEIWAWGLYT